MDKKTAKKTIYILFLGLFTAVILYPLLHETGHLLSVGIFGGKIAEFSFLFNRTILCDITDFSENQTALVGLSGVLLPTAFSLIFNFKTFTAKLTLLFLRFINIYVLFLSMLYAFAYRFDVYITENDILTALSVSPTLFYATAFGFGVLIFILYHQIKKTAPLSFISKFMFDETAK